MQNGETLRDTWGMVKSGMWNELDQGRPKAIHLLEQSVLGMWPHTAYVQFLGLSDPTTNGARSKPAAGVDLIAQRPM